MDCACGADCAALGSAAVANPHDLCRWLGLDFAQLQWFADRKHLNAKTANTKFEHHTYRVLAKPRGGWRLIEAPKRTLKELQRRILSELLEKIPAHPAAHGFVAGRSIQTFVAPHTNKAAVLRIDLQDFFPSIRAARVSATFRTCGYPERVADFLAGLCTNAVPRRVWGEVHAAARFELHETYGATHLPQGAPTSPALANLVAYRLDCRLAALAKKAGAAYTRYADDLAFSGNEEFARRARRFALHVAAIAMEEGFEVNHRKTRIMRRGRRQHLAGVTVNAHANLQRPEFDVLKAILANCGRHGAESQNRDRHPAFREHLSGRVGFVESLNPAKGARLRRMFEKISW
ncbi:MAG TPA: reverse transcriptase family protein [Candidatus Koribacter sp.]